MTMTTTVKELAGKTVVIKNNASTHRLGVAGQRGTVIANWKVGDIHYVRVDIQMEPRAVTLTYEEIDFP